MRVAVVGSGTTHAATHQAWYRPSVHGATANVCGAAVLAAATVATVATVAAATAATVATATHIILYVHEVAPGIRPEDMSGRIAAGEALGVGADRSGTTAAATTFASGTA